MLSREEVNKFLEAFKAQVVKEGHYTPEIAKNQKGLIALGITKRHRRQVILSLTCQNYSEGPSEDRTYPGEMVWVFGATVEGTEVYIKLKLPPAGEPTCLSFHPAERPMTYPLRATEEGRK